MIEFSDDKARLDIALVHGWLSSSYWTPGIERSLVERAIAGSHCLGAYRDGVQVGFARAVTDYAHFAWIDDVWVDAAVRRQGIAGEMVRWFLDNPSFATVGRFALATRDAHGVYERVGFHAPLRPDRWMERLSTEAAAKVQA